MDSTVALPPGCKSCRAISLFLTATGPIPVGRVLSAQPEIKLYGPADQRKSGSLHLQAGVVKVARRLCSNPRGTANIPSRRIRRPLQRLMTGARPDSRMTRRVGSSRPLGLYEQKWNCHPVRVISSKAPIIEGETNSPSNNEGAARVSKGA